MIELQLSMATLVYSLIEENGPRQLDIAKVSPHSISLAAVLLCAVSSVICITKLNISQRSQIIEDIVEPSLPAREINLKASAPEIRTRNLPADPGN